jgi:hypothetical protein
VPERGMIIREPKDGSGLLAVSGKQYAFVLDELWHSSAAPELGMAVDVTFNPDGAPESVQCADQTQPARSAVSPKLS